MAIQDACRNVGFFYVKNHGIRDEHLEAVFSDIKAFFDLPLEEKVKIHMGKSQIFRGYTPIALWPPELGLLRSELAKKLRHSPQMELAYCLDR